MPGILYRSLKRLLRSGAHSEVGEAAGPGIERRAPAILSPHAGGADRRRCEARRMDALQSLQTTRKLLSEAKS